MQLTIYSKNGKAKATVSPNDSSTQQKEVQGDNVLSLTFTHYSHIALDVNDYTDFEGEHYWLMEKYQPTQKSEGEWEYDLKMYGVESLIKRFLVLEATDGNAEPVFTLTAPPREHVAMVVKCINDGLNHTTDWKVGDVDGTDNIVIDYEGKYCDEALQEIAEAVGGQAEWWIEGQTVNISRCEHGEELTLAYGAGLLGLERDTSNTNKFYTRLFPIGSTRNIDAEKYGHSRLMLPGGQQYVELHTGEYGIYDHYEEDAFSDIYPRRVGTVTGVRSKEVKDDDGDPYIIYYFSDGTLTFDPNDYEIAGLVKHVSFQEGSELAGLGTDDDHYFEVNYDSKTKEFEIITIWPYDDDTQLPGGSLVPKVGDEYILWNIRMPDEYYTIAENELAEAVEEYNAEHWQDISIYKGTTDHVWVERNGAELFVGRRIRLESSRYFPTDGYRSSRITKLTRKVTEPGQVDLEISDTLQTGALDKVTDSVRELKNYTRERTAGSLPDIIRSWDNTLPTDTNLFSARRSQKEFISKTKADRAKGRITFEDGVSFGQEDGGSIDGKGNGELATLAIRDNAKSPSFASGFDGNGWRMWLDESGLAGLELDTLTVRQRMRIYELLIDKVRSVGGELIVSAANGKVASVEEQGDYYRITFETANQFVAHDLVRCQTFSGSVLKSYWVEVTLADGEGVSIAKTEFDGYVPAVGDECVLMGNTEDAKRMSVVQLSATDDGQPRVDVVNGISGKSTANGLRTRLGNLDGIEDPYFGDDQPQGDGLYADNAYLKGKFVLRTGEDVQTKFEITEGKIESTVAAVRDDFVEGKGYLNNPAFANGISQWQTESETSFFLLGNKWQWVNGNALSRKGDGASVTTDDGRTVVRIRNKYIRQLNKNLRSKPTFTTNANGEKEALPVYLSFFYRCAKTGTLKVWFEGIDKTGFANFNSMEVEETIAETYGYIQYTCDGLWNGTGDFTLSFDGDIFLYMLVLSTDKIESLTYKYKTLFEQSERLVKISAAVFDKDENALQETGLFVKPEGAGLYAQDADGNTALIGVSSDGTLSSIKLAADHIKLEGLVTANDNFKILDDGSIEAENAKLDGYLYCKFVPIGASDAEALGTENTTFVSFPGSFEYLLKKNLYVDATHCGVVLPVSTSYEGARVIVADFAFYVTRTIPPATTVRTEDGSDILGGMFQPEDTEKPFCADCLRITSGTVELTLVNYKNEDGADKGLRWVVIGKTCHILSYTHNGTIYEC